MTNRMPVAVLLIPGLLQAPQLNAETPNALETMELDVAVAYEPRPGQFGITELMLAAGKGDSDRVRALLEGGADVDAANQWGQTALMGAAYAGDLTTVGILLKWQADINLVDSKGTSALGNVVWAGDSRMAAELLMHGADPNVPVYASETPVLQHAAVTGQAEIVDLLIGHGADLAAAGERSLAAAAWKGETEIVRSLLQAGVGANADGGFEGRTAVHLAVENDHADTIRLLIEYGADTNRLASDNVTPLRTAINRGSAATLEILLDNGARASSEDFLLALDRKSSTVADMVFARIDTGALTKNELDEILIAAELAEQSSLVEKILVTSRERLALPSARLLFAKSEADGCAMTLWNPGNGDRRILASYAAECPAHVFVAERNSTVFVIEERVLHIMPFDRRAIPESINLPNEQINARLVELQERLEKQMFETYGDQMSMNWMRAEPAVAGMLEGGELAVAIHSKGPVEDTYAYLYALQENGDWVMVEERSCDRFDWLCEFGQLDGRKVEYWPDLRKIWHPRARANEFFMSKTIQERHMKWDFGRPDVIQFNIAGRKPLWAFSTSEETHGNYRATSAIKFAVDDSAAPDIMCHSCETSLASRYLLVGEPFGRPCQLFDLGTGDSVLGLLEFATWVD